MDRKELKTFKDKILQKAAKERDWYIANSRKKKMTSKTIRIFTIVFIGLGTLCPLLESTGFFPDSWEVSRWGYVAFAIGGIFLGYDNFFGVSSGWIRYTLASMEINKLSDNFEFDWQSSIGMLEGESISEEKTLEAIAILKAYMGSVQGIVIKETENWAKEFENSLMELSRSTSNGKT